MAKVIDFDERTPEKIVTGAEGSVLFMHVVDVPLWNRGGNVGIQKKIDAMYADGWHMVGGPAVTPVRAESATQGLYVTISFERPTYAAPPARSFPFIG